MLAWLPVWSELQTWIWPSWCHCHSLSLASVKSRLAYPGSPEKRAVKRVCVCVCVCVCVWRRRRSESRHKIDKSLTSRQRARCSSICDQRRPSTSTTAQTKSRRSPSRDTGSSTTWLTTTDQHGCWGHGDCTRAHNNCSNAAPFLPARRYASAGTSYGPVSVSVCLVWLQGRLNQWAHWARAQGPRIFFFLRGPNWLWWNNFVKTNYLFTFGKINCKGNPVNTY